MLLMLLMLLFGSILYCPSTRGAYVSHFDSGPLDQVDVILSCYLNLEDQRVPMDLLPSSHVELSFSGLAAILNWLDANKPKFNVFVTYTFSIYLDTFTK